MPGRSIRWQRLTVDPTGHVSPGANRKHVEGEETARGETSPEERHALPLVVLLGRRKRGKRRWYAADPSIYSVNSCMI
jgi:hypothetical protein